MSRAAPARPAFRLHAVLAAAWIAAVLIAYLLQFSAYVRPILTLLR